MYPSYLLFVVSYLGLQCRLDELSWYIPVFFYPWLFSSEVVILLWLWEKLKVLLLHHLVQIPDIATERVKLDSAGRGGEVVLWKWLRERGRQRIMTNRVFSLFPQICFAHIFRLSQTSCLQKNKTSEQIFWMTILCIT